MVMKATNYVFIHPAMDHDWLLKEKEGLFNQRLLWIFNILTIYIETLEKQESIRI